MKNRRKQSFPLSIRKLLKTAGMNAITQFPATKTKNYMTSTGRKPKN